MYVAMSFPDWFISLISSDLDMVTGIRRFACLSGVIYEGRRQRAMLNVGIRINCL